MSSNTHTRDNDGSILEHRYQIPCISKDLVRWNKKWEKVMRTLSFDEVYSALSLFWNSNSAHDENTLSKHARSLGTLAFSLQCWLVRQKVILEDRGSFELAWRLLNDEERTRYLLKGLDERCQNSPLAQDSRAICPEINLRVLLKEQGKPFIRLIHSIKEGKESMKDGALYRLPNEWWDKGGEKLQPSARVTFKRLTVQRNEFICQFLQSVIASVMNDLHSKKGGMARVHAILTKSDETFRRICPDLIENQFAKPIIRCENCTKSPNEIEGHPNFSVCSSCKSKLDFTIHYCSRKCQKQDWHNHRTHCGVKKASKQLKGTVNDPYRTCPTMPDCLRTFVEAGNVMVNFTGTPDLAKTQSKALQRQTSLLARDEEVAYFLFNRANQPVAFKIRDRTANSVFRMMRLWGFIGRQDQLGPFAEHLLSKMEDHPGLSRSGILAQLSEEYEFDMEEELAILEDTRKRPWLICPPRLEQMCENHTRAFPKEMAVLQNLNSFEEKLVLQWAATRRGTLKL